ncbi:unnamed protein product [Haemonchus placei]|uniref:Reverse transcriptase domain-containing protein n=1 Tax=Haemonchus placei TaxID=6290 RepID=A0A0N4WQ46_HAEPC|nr:unnamed protein product [Haemonchus placei]
MDLEKLHKEDHTFFKVIVDDFNTNIGPTRTAEELHKETHVGVVPKNYTGSDHRLLHTGFRFSVRGERELNSENEAPRLWPNGITSLHWRVCGKIPSAITSMKSTTGSLNIFTIAPGELRVSKMSRNVSLEDS